MRKHLLTIFLTALLCLALTGCGGYPSDGPKLEPGDYLQTVLLYDGTATLTADEIFRRCWRISEDGSLQYKLETAEEFVDCGTPKLYNTTAEKLAEAFANGQLPVSAEYLLTEITDGQLYKAEAFDVLLLRAAEGSTLLATMENDTVTSLFLLETGEIPPTAIPMAYEWDPYAVSDIYSNIFGHRFKNDFQSMVGAILNGDYAFYCSDSGNAQRLHTYGDAVFPPYSQLVANIFFEDGMAHIIYKTFNDEDRLAILDEFRRSVEYLVGSALKEGDTPTTMAIALYHAYSYQITYDYDATFEDRSLTAYRALTEYTGIARNFSAAYAYLCTQMGISAVPAGGINTSGRAHDWTLIRLDDRYFYADPTWETTAGGTGLQYFGMTTQQRYDEDQFLAHYTSIANSNALWGNNVDVSDQRFFPLQDIVHIEQMWRTDGKLTIRGTNAAGETIELTAE